MVLVLFPEYTSYMHTTTKVSGPITVVRLFHQFFSSEQYMSIRLISVVACGLGTILYYADCSLQLWTSAFWSQRLLCPLLLKWVFWLWPDVNQLWGMYVLQLLMMHASVSEVWVYVSTHSCSQCLQTDNACGWCIYNKVCSGTPAPCTSGTNWFQVYK